ncbi:MAG: DUF4249 family protein [Calditrichaeota bacterium]|nr:MAG: DUF4249 family protein [Calditrichota bacterium]
MLEFRKIFRLLTLWSIYIFQSCGEPTLDFIQNNELYLVINGFISPNKTVDGIYISRALAIEEEFSQFEIYIKDAKVEIQELDSDGSIIARQILVSRENVHVDTLEIKTVWEDEFGNPVLDENGKEVLVDKTIFDTTVRWEYYDPTNSFQVKHNTSYKLDVEYDGVKAWSTTTVPDSGFKLLGTVQGKNEFVYGIENPILAWESSENHKTNGYYTITIRPKEYNKSNFIYNNIFSAFEDTTKLSEEEWVDFADFMRGQSYTVEFDDGSVINHQLIWFKFWFYTNYEIVVHACDKNYYDHALMLTIGNQEPDGNFAEGLNHVEGKGFGVFAGVVSDTLELRITNYENNL